MDFEVLGPFGVRDAGGLIELRGDKRRGLLALLVIRAGQPCSLDSIVDALWNGAPVPGVPATVRTYVSQLRKVLSDGVSLDTRTGAYLLSVGSDAVDAARFERLVDRAALEDDVAARLALLDDALALWRGDPLAEFAGAAWADDAVRGWERLRLVAIDQRVDALLDLGRSAEAALELERAIEADPLHEHLWVQLALARYRNGNQAGALAACRDARHALGEELGVDPGPELVEVERQILDHDASLQWAGRSERTLRASVAAPTGSVTFLVTDVERSSHLWERDARSMAEALERHDEIVTAAVAAHGGTVFKQLGDGHLSAFARTSEAVAAAVAAQAALLGEAWPRGSPLRVRMALHCGEAVVERDGDYFGPVLNRCARIVALANGGQVLVSGSVADVLRDHPVEDVALLPLGEHQLRDLVEPERIAQVLHPSLPAEFSNLRLIDGVQGALPLQITSFVGRDDDVRRLVELVPTISLTTLVGLGGVGKTRLALQASTVLATSFPDGVWFVEIAAIDEAALVPNAVASALGVPRVDGEDMTEALVNYLASRRLLLVIDNCEQVVDGAAALVARVVRVVPGVRVLATSRQPLELAGEHVFPVLPLPVVSLGDAMSAAETLFVLRAKEAAPGFVVNVENEETVRQLCARLEGLPLAIELAAARVRTLSPEQLVERLDDRFRLLRGTRRDQSGRHQTLRAAVEWSYDLLDAAERDLFERLSVFRGGFDVDAVEEIANDLPVDALELIDRLVSRSLVVAETLVHTRFRVLETLREYGAERLEASGRRGAVEARHARFFLQRAVALAMNAHHTSDGARDLDRDLDNLRAALAWHVEHEPAAAAAAVLGLWRYFVSRSMVVESQQWLEALVERVDERDLVLRARLLERLGDACLLSGAHAEAGIEWLARALTLYENEGDDLRAARVHTALARNLSAYPTVMDIERALEHAVKAEAILACHDDERMHAEVRAMHASIALYGRRNRAGLAAASEAQRQAARLGVEGLRLHALAQQGAHLGYCGDVEDGFSMLEQAWIEADRAGDAFVSFLAAWMRGFAAFLVADPGDACVWWTREREQPRTVAGPLQQRTLDCMLGLGNLRLGHVERARAIGADDVVNAPELRPHLAMCETEWDHAARLLTEARQLTLRQGNRNEWTQLTLLHARLRARVGDHAGAAALAGEALETLEIGDCPYYEIPARSLVAGAGIDTQAHLDGCRALLERHDYRGLAGGVELAEARAAVASDDEAVAVAAFARARDVFDRYQLKFEEIETLAEWGRALVKWGSDDGAARLAAAREMLDEIGTPRWGALVAGVS